MKTEGADRSNQNPKVDPLEVMLGTKRMREADTENFYEGLHNVAKFLSSIHFVLGYYGEGRQKGISETTLLALSEMANEFTEHVDVLIEEAKRLAIPPDVEIPEANLDLRAARRILKAKAAREGVRS